MRDRRPIRPPMAHLIVNIDVDDLDRAARFYAQALSLEIGRRFPSAIELRSAEAPIWLLHNASGTVPFTGASTTRSYQRHWTPVHLDFTVAELEAAVRRAEDAGARLEAPISDHVWGRMALLSDPFGHGFCLLEFRGRGPGREYDEIETDMDQRDVVASESPVC